MTCVSIDYSAWQKGAGRDGICGGMQIGGNCWNPVMYSPAAGVDNDQTAGRVLMLQGDKYSEIKPAR